MQENLEFKTHKHVKSHLHLYQELADKKLCAALVQGLGTFRSHATHESEQPFLNKI